MKYFSKTLLALAFLLATTVATYAQPGDPEEDPDNAVPITGIEWLLAGGAALGIKKLVSSKKDKQEIL